MRFKRRGRRSSLVGISNRIRSTSSDGEALLRELVARLQKPTAQIPASIAAYRKLYDGLSPAQQKNLIDKTANQILFAHSDIVQRILKHLSRISMDWGQETEVLYRKRMLNR